MSTLQIKRNCKEVDSPNHSSSGSVGNKRVKVLAYASTNLGNETVAVKSCFNQVETSKSYSNENGLVCGQPISSSAIQDLFQKHKVAMEFYQVALSKFESISDDLRALPDIFHKHIVAMEFCGVSLLKFHNVSDDLKNIIGEHESRQPSNSNEVKWNQELNFTMETKIKDDHNSNKNMYVIDSDSDEEDCKCISYEDENINTNSVDKLLESSKLSTNPMMWISECVKQDTPIYQPYIVTDLEENLSHTKVSEINNEKQNGKFDEDLEVIELINDSDEDNHIPDHDYDTDHQRDENEVEHTNDMRHHKKKEQNNNNNNNNKDNPLEKLEQEYFHQIKLNKLYKEQLLNFKQINYDKKIDRDINNNSTINPKHPQKEQEHKNEGRRVTKKKAMRTKLTKIVSKNNHLRLKIKTRSTKVIPSCDRVGEHITRRINTQESPFYSEKVSSSNQFINSSIEEKSNESDETLNNKTSEDELLIEKLTKTADNLRSFVPESKLKEFCENYKELQKKKGKNSFSLVKLPCPLCSCFSVEVKIHKTNHLQAYHNLSNEIIELLRTKMEIYLEMDNIDCCKRKDKNKGQSSLVESEQNNNKLSVNNHGVLLKQFSNYLKLKSSPTSGYKKRNVFLKKLRNFFKFVEYFHLSYTNLFKTKNECLELVNIINKYFNIYSSNSYTLRKCLINLRVLTKFLFESDKLNSIDLYVLIKLKFKMMTKHLYSKERLSRIKYLKSINAKMWTKEILNTIYNHPYYIKGKELLMKSQPLRENLVRVRILLTFSILTRNLGKGGNVIDMQLKDALEPKFNEEKGTYCVCIYNTARTVVKAQLSMSELLYSMLKQYIERFRVFVSPCKEEFKELVFMSMNGKPLNYISLHYRHKELANRCELKGFERKRVPVTPLVHNYS